MRKLQIATLSSEYSGILQYRWTQPLYELSQRGHKIVVMPDITDRNDPDYEKKLAICTKIIMSSDILYMVSPGFLHTFQMCYDLKQAKPELKLVADFDDDQFNISPFNQAYNYCGCKEIKVDIDGGIEWLWKNGVADFDVARNKRNAKATAMLISMLDMVIVTTERLKFKYRRYVDKNKIKVIPNAVKFDTFSLYKKVDKGDGKIRIVWPVSSSHLTDWMDIRASLGNALKRNKNTVLVTLGVEMGGGRDIPLSQHEHVGWAMGYAGYLHNLFTSGADIGICPLSDNRFNWKKSPIKWEEMSAMYLPAVVSNVMYGDYVKDGETGLVYNTKQEFEDKLQSLIDSAELRRTIGKNANAEVKQSYNILNIASQYEHELETLCGTNKIIEVVQ